MVDSSRLAVEVERTFDCLVVVESDVNDLLARSGVSGRPAFVVRLVVEEVLRNLVEHAAGAGTWVRLDISCEPDEITIIIEDDADPFDPDRVPAVGLTVPVEQHSGRGLGLHLLREMTDDLVYETFDDLNRLTARVDPRRVAR